MSGGRAEGRWAIRNAQTTLRHGAMSETGESDRHAVSDILASPQRTHRILVADTGSGVKADLHQAGCRIVSLIGDTSTRVWWRFKYRTVCVCELVRL